jgi:hypothetical protein
MNEFATIFGAGRGAQAIREHMEGDQYYFSSLDNYMSNLEGSFRWMYVTQMQELIKDHPLVTRPKPCAEFDRNNKAFNHFLLGTAVEEIYRWQQVIEHITQLVGYPADKGPCTRKTIASQYSSAKDGRSLAQILVDEIKKDISAQYQPQRGLIRPHLPSAANRLLPVALCILLSDYTLNNDAQSLQAMADPEDLLTEINKALISQYSGHVQLYGDMRAHINTWEPYYQRMLFIDSKSCKAIEQTSNRNDVFVNGERRKLMMKELTDYIIGCVELPF